MRSPQTTPTTLRCLVVALTIVFVSCSTTRHPTPVDDSPSAGAMRARVFLVRHAEKERNQGDDPALTPAGVRRADDLAEFLAPSGVTHLFASEYQRTQATVAPLASRLGIEVTVVPAGDLDALARALRALPDGSTAVVAGHSNTLPSIARALGATLENLTQTDRGAWLGDAEYDRLFLLLPSPGSATRMDTLELRYGD